MRYFYKELPEQVYSPGGRPINVDFTDPEGYGWLATDNGYAVNQIEQAIQARIGGWVLSDKASYDEAIKKKEAAPAPRPNRSAHTFQPFHLAGRGAAAFAAGGAKPPSQAPTPEPISVPKAEQMQPRSGRIGVRPPPSTKKV